MKLLNQKGNAVLFILLAFILLALAIPITMKLFKPADIIMRIILVFLIFTIVRGYLGSGTLSLIVSGVLIYFLVIKWAYVTATIYVIYILMGFAFFSVIVWGIGTRMRGGMGGR